MLLADVRGREKVRNGTGARLAFLGVTGQLSHTVSTQSTTLKGGCLHVHDVAKVCMLKLAAAASGIKQQGRRSCSAVRCRMPGAAEGE